MKTLTKKNSTSAERKFGELLKQLRIPFRFRVKINNREVDFLIGKYVIEIDGHGQDPKKNIDLVGGYIPIHFTNQDISNTKLIKLWLEQISLHR